MAMLRQESDYVRTMANHHWAKGALKNLEVWQWTGSWQEKRISSEWLKVLHIRKALNAYGKRAK
jgi:hypothetical protein